MGIKVSDNLEINTSIEDVIRLIKFRCATIKNKDVFNTLKYNGNDIQTNCPFHTDNKPSFGIDRRTGVWHCFSCNRKGNLISLVKQVLELKTYDLAKQWLIDNFQSTLYTDEGLQEFKDTIQRKLKGVNVEKKESKLKGKVVYVSDDELKSYKYYHQYMFDRGLTKDIIKKFDIGFDQNFDGGAITFPVRDLQGRTLFIARRCVNKKKFHYPDGSEKPLYGIYELKQYYPNVTEIWLCESIIDALRLWCNNIPAIALNGLGSDYQFKQLQKLGIKSIVLATDNDTAGQKARKIIKKSVKGIIFKEAQIPKNHKDIGECSDNEIKKIVVTL